MRLLPMATTMYLFSNLVVAVPVNYCDVNFLSTVIITTG